MDNKIPYSQWTLDEWKYVKIVRFRAPFTRSMAGAELVFTLPFILDANLVRQIDNFVLESIKSYDPQASMHSLVLNMDEYKKIILRNYSNCKQTTFAIYNNPSSDDVFESASKGRTSWWSFRAQFNVYVSPYIDEIDFEVYKNSGAFITYPLSKELEIETQMKAIWDNARNIEELEDIVNNMPSKSE